MFVGLSGTLDVPEVPHSKGLVVEVTLLLSFCPGVTIPNEWLESRGGVPLRGEYFQKTSEELLLLRITRGGTTQGGYFRGHIFFSVFVNDHFDLYILVKM